MTKCDECKFIKIQYEAATGMKLDPLQCGFRKDKPAPFCAFPPPLLLGWAKVAWDLFDKSKTVVIGGMDILKSTATLAEAQKLAEAYEVPWCEYIANRYIELREIWLTGVLKKMEHERNKIK